MGDDFAYYYADETYEYVDKFAATMSNATDGQYEFVYSSVESYLESVLTQIHSSNIQLKEFSDDFFPLNMQYQLHFWNGYYTSRPNFKELLRDLTYETYISTSLYSMEVMKGQSHQGRLSNSSNEMQAQVSVMQHHDTITATSKDYVIKSEASTVERVLKEAGQIMS